MDNAYDRVMTEWAIACRRARVSGLAAHWEATEPALAGIACLEDALARCHDQRHPATAHAAVAALLVLAEDDAVARLAVVRALLPGLAGLAHRGRHLGDRSSGRDPSRRRRIGSSWLWPGPWDGLDNFDDDKVVVLAFVPVRKLAGQHLAWPVNAVLSRVDRQLRLREAACRRPPPHESLTLDDGVDIEVPAPTAAAG
jgi:hypothetical protein